LLLLFLQFFIISVISFDRRRSSAQKVLQLVHFRLLAPGLLLLLLFVVRRRRLVFLLLLRFVFLLVLLVLLRHTAHELLRRRLTDT